MRIFALLFSFLLCSMAYGQECGFLGSSDVIVPKIGAVQKSTPGVRCFQTAVLIVNGVNGQYPYVISPEQITSNVLRNLNQGWNTHDIQFNYLRHEVINDPERFDIETNKELRKFLLQYAANNEYTVLVVNSLPPNVAAAVRELGDNAQVVDLAHHNSNTIIHEAGHNLWLHHTHKGTFTPSDADEGIPETPNGSNPSPNCEDAGDFVCDTFADPGLSGNVSSSTCSYNNSEPNYDPPVNNHMSYSWFSCRNEFTEGQVARSNFLLAGLGGNTYGPMGDIVQSACNPIIGAGTICAGQNSTYSIGQVQNQSSITWHFPVNQLYAVNGQGTNSIVLNAFTVNPPEIQIRAEVVLSNGVTLNYYKEVIIESNSTPSTPTIAQHPDAPSNLIVGQTNTFFQAKCISNCNYATEYTITAQYLNPADQMTYDVQSGLIGIVKNTSSPVVLNVRARNTSTCGQSSSYSNNVSRYYGAVSGTKNQLNSAASLYSHDNIIGIRTPRKQDWLYQFYGNVDLSESQAKQLERVLNDASNKLSIKVYTLEGTLLSQQVVEYNVDQILSESVKSGSYIVVMTDGSNRRVVKHKML